jgi:hypothetical protein
VLDGNFALGWAWNVLPQIRIFQCMLERTDTITNEVLETITFVLAHPTVQDCDLLFCSSVVMLWPVCRLISSIYDLRKKLATVDSSLASAFVYSIFVYKIISKQRNLILLIVNIWSLASLSFQTFFGCWLNVTILGLSFFIKIYPYYFTVNGKTRKNFQTRHTKVWPKLGNEWF